MGYTVAFDPGDTTGIAVWNADYQLEGMHQIPWDEIVEWWQEFLSDKTVDDVIIEEFVLFKSRALSQAGSKMKTSQAIGTIKTMAKLNDSPVTMQRSDILPAGIKMSGIKMPSAHSQSHQFCAYVHGFVFLHQKGKVESPLEREMREKREARK